MTAALEDGEWSAARPGRTLPPPPPRERRGTQNLQKCAKKYDRPGQATYYNTEHAQ